MVHFVKVKLKLKTESQIHASTLLAVSFTMVLMVAKSTQKTLCFAIPWLKIYHAYAAMKPQLEADNTSF